ncbi:hypothetical protein KIW84_041536 [Lathyrus oleraceus]|uniref:ATP-dependent DNA helicase n=1 Tax=Pisum sativum TaxID=3888 RepID=A0A9D5AR98_PEA|nr:hypothetical protein KIW84_041536 [Pisum sativum]
MKDKHCKKRYPKQFLDETRQGTNSYPEYRRRFDESISLGRYRSVDNRWVVPYNPWLLLKYDCHINVEICSSIKSIKYLYKYVYKGPDRVAMEVHKGSYMDEVQQYVDARWICSPDALWKIFRFTLYRLYPSVERLQIHLPNRHQVRFYDHQRIEDVLNNERNSKTMLTQFFALNLRDPQARNYLYREILEHYCLNKRDMECPTSWEYLLTNNGMTFNTFKKSVEDRGFLETDHSIHDCLVEATSLRMPYALQRDYQTTNNVVELNLTDMLLKDLNELLNLHGKKIEDYDLPSLPPNTIDRDAIPSIIQEELTVDIPNENIEYVTKLNNDQMIAFKPIMNVIVEKHNGVFFVDGLGGTAATLLSGGRTAHSRFKMPIDIQPSSICGIQKQKDLSNLVRVVAAIIWDKEPMTNKNCLEALDRSLQDICSNNASFGGKVLIMGEDFCQVLLVVRKDDMVMLPSHIAIPWEGEHSIQVFIQHIFPNLEFHGWDAPYMVQRAILTPTNDDVQKLNDMIIDQFPGEEHSLLSFDEVE